MRLQPEMLWKAEPQVDEARKLPGWVAFHRACAGVTLFFDHPTRDGRRWRWDAFTTRGYATVHLATGEGRTALDALEDAYRKSGRANADTDAAWDALHGAPVDDSWKELLGI